MTPQPDNSALRQHLPPGFGIGDYILGDVIGKGGFGIVYKAVHSERQIKVVIKELFPFHTAE
ncbi:MAG: hypothetical protein F6K16_41875 [Symploca sp. SIO2B6]|nr:hypothetical protein [Symploca sp. SIO2B6]